ncbi:hypothetical protein MCOR02_007424, partial [Pyricularia oryzae]
MHVDEVMQRIPGAGSEIHKEANRTGFCGSGCKHSKAGLNAKGLGGPGRLQLPYRTHRQPKLCSSRDGWQMAFNQSTTDPVPKRSGSVAWHGNVARQ